MASRFHFLGVRAKRLLGVTKGQEVIDPVVISKLSHSLQKARKIAQNKKQPAVRKSVDADLDLIDKAITSLYGINNKINNAPKDQVESVKRATMEDYRNICRVLKEQYLRKKAPQEPQQTAQDPNAAKRAA